MARNILNSLVACSVLVVLGSCSSATAHIAVARANQNFGRGNFQRAMVAYLRLLSIERYSSLLAYNLGNVYHSLGEGEAALRMWDNARTTASQKLLFNIVFNKGVQFYEQGRYQEAFEQFRHALELNGSDLDTKLNLELSLRKLRAGEAIAANRRSSPTATTESEADSTTDTESLRLLEYIRRKEGQIWSALLQPTGRSPADRDW